MGQVAVNAKSNEIPAMRDLLGMMGITGLVIIQRMPCAPNVTVPP